MDKMEKKFEINTGQGARNIFTTDRIAGELQAIILINAKPMQVEIQSELGYPIFRQMSERVGQSYYSVKTMSLNEKAERVYGTSSNFFLNERLVITVSGQRNETMTVILRYG